MDRIAELEEENEALKAQKAAKPSRGDADDHLDQITPEPHMLPVVVVRVRSTTSSLQLVE